MTTRLVSSRLVSPDIHTLTYCIRSSPLLFPIRIQECDPSQPKIIQEWLENSLNGGKVRFESSHKDMFGKDRFVKLRVL
jgi:hypothetical protein